MHDRDTKFTTDSTDMETTSASAHFQSRCGKKRTKYVKHSVCVLVGSLLPSGVDISLNDVSIAVHRTPEAVEYYLDTIPARAISRTLFEVADALKFVTTEL